MTSPLGRGAHLGGAGAAVGRAADAAGTGGRAELVADGGGGHVRARVEVDAIEVHRRNATRSLLTWRHCRSGIRNAIGSGIGAMGEPKILESVPRWNTGSTCQPRRFIFRPCSTRSALLKRSGSNHRARTARRRRRGRTRGSRKQGEKRAVAGAATGSDGTDGDDGKRQGWVGGNHLLFRDVRVIVVSSRARVAHYSAHVSLVVRSRKLRVRGGARANSEGDEPRPLPVSGVGATKRRRRARRRVGVRQMDAGGARFGVHERVQSQQALGRL